MTRIIRIVEIIDTIQNLENISKERYKTFTVVIPACGNRRYGLALGVDEDHNPVFTKTVKHGNLIFNFYSDWDDTNEYLQMPAITITQDNISYTVRYREEKPKETLNPGIKKALKEGCSDLLRFMKDNLICTDIDWINIKKADDNHAIMVVQFTNGHQECQCFEG